MKKPTKTITLQSNLPPIIEAIGVSPNPPSSASLHYADSITMPAVANSFQSETLHTPKSIIVANSPFLVAKNDTSKRWTKRLEKKFDRLILLEDTGKITQNQKDELNRLQSLRRALKNPLSVEERIYETKRDEIIRETILALTKYVQFIKTTNNTHSRASGNPETGRKPRTATKPTKILPKNQNHERNLRLSPARNTAKL